MLPFVGNNAFCGELESVAGYRGNEMLCTDGNEIPCPSAGQPFYGQDAQYTSIAPSYENLGNGTVKDNNTGLIWQKSNDGAIRACLKTQSSASPDTVKSYS